MNDVQLLDCTLRDGGYVNDWSFGEDAISDIIHRIENSNIDILELGFLRDEPYQTDRVIFNSMDQVKNLIPQKRTGTQYAVMAEVSNPFPLEKLCTADARSADIIRVIIWKTKRTSDGQMVDALEEGFQYCKGIVEKGYKLCVQPARVDQYTDDEFLEMVQHFSKLEPMAIYVVDSWGTQNPDQLLHYMRLAHENMPKEIALGYHGHNNMMQALSVAQAMLSEGFERRLMIDASVYGIGRGAGNLNLEIIAKYLNEHFGKNYDTAPMLDILDHYIQPIYLREQWGYSIPYYLTAKYNCNPSYARFYSMILKISNEKIEHILQTFCDENWVIYKDTIAYERFCRYQRKIWEKKLCIIIPTANRPECIEYYLEECSRTYAHLGIDLIIFDSSTDNRTEKITKRYTDYEGSTTIYCRYQGEYDGVSIDTKVIDAYLRYLDQYEYLWVCRDGHLINFPAVCDDLFEIFEEGPEAVIVYDNWQNDHGFPKKKKYTDCAALLEDHCCHTAILGVMIFSADFIRDVIRTQPVDPIKNYGLWQPMAMFEYWAERKPKVTLYVEAVYRPNIHGTENSFWNKSGRALWQWGQRWYEMVDNLPACYDTRKEKIMKVGMRDFTPFEPRQLLIMRANGGLTLGSYRKYKQYLDHVTEMAAWKFYAICLVPKPLCRYYLENEDRPVRRGIKFIYQQLKRLYHFIAPKTGGDEAGQIAPNYDLGLENFEKSQSLSAVCFEKKQLAIIIPTHGRASIIEDHLNALGAVYLEYGADVIVFDSSQDDSVREVVSKYQRELGGALIYHHFQMDSNERSIDRKVMEAYAVYSDDYEYLWVLRDRTGALLNNCAVELLKQMRKKPDMIVVYNYEDERRFELDLQYTDCRKFFQDHFNLMTALGQTVVRSEFIRAVLADQPLDKVKNYGLWQPIAFFHYIADHPFSASVCSGYIFKHHRDALKGSFWQRQLLYQWVERFYLMFKTLPPIYNGLFYHVILEWNERYHLLDVPYLLDTRKKGGLFFKEVEEYEEIIPYISSTPIKYYKEIATMPPRKAAKIYMNYERFAKSYLETDHSLLGSFSPEGDIAANDEQEAKTAP